ncbi:MAG: carboxypeptidase regulatory-like domain-containing protein [Acidobacteria bacterium]|nr:carboxypeptidase regulatory-like domain-containing protein [Acidobacteriota bacterium]
MKKTLMVLATAIAIFFNAAAAVDAAELIVNGGFETGNFTGWTATTTGSGWYPWQVTATGGGDTTGGITTSSPLFGTRSAWTGFCCNPTNNPEYIQQQVVLPAAQTASVQWSDKIQSNLTSFCSVPACGSNVWRVQVLNTSNVVLQTLYTFTANGGANYNSGWVTHTVDLSAYAGQTIRIRFGGTYNSTIGGLTNGPGRAEVDGVSVQSPSIVPTAATVSIGGRITTADGLGIRNSEVLLTDSQGVTRRVQTGSFGSFRFDEVEVGNIYVIRVNARRFTFAQSERVLMVNENAVDIDFVAIE